MIQLPEVSLLSLWTNNAHLLPTVFSCPFAIFGTLAIAESQAREQRRESRRLDDSRSRSTSRSRPRKMATNSLGGVLGLYRRLPRTSYRLLKAVMLNLLADRLGGRAQVSTTTRTRKNIWFESVRQLFLSTLVAPIRLLCTEVVIFKRFDWRSLQMNARILPILLPNFVRSVLDLVLGLLAQPLSVHWCLFTSEISAGLQLSLYKRGYHLGLWTTLYCTVYALSVMAEIVRVRTDLLVLNGDSDHSILPINETYQGGYVEAAQSDEEYSIYNTISRYVKLTTIPTLLMHALAGLSIPFVNMTLGR